MWREVAASFRKTFIYSSILNTFFVLNVEKYNGLFG